ncbi:treslin [Hoplias malabaricus]|uniref:treslin n=1 Tax=Hoplias malabaricus TaxID=27720 RepID=UPI003461B5A9
MASHNVVFAIDVDYSSEGFQRSVSSDSPHNIVKRWILKVLLSLGSKHGFEKVRWGYRFFHSKSVRSTSLWGRSTDFKELQEKAFTDFEEELVKFTASDMSSDDRQRHRASSASCLHKNLKEILLDFHWDRPDITSPTKLSLRPRRSGRSNNNISLSEDDLSGLGKNVLFVVSSCPHSGRELEDFINTRETTRDLHELVLPKRIIDLLIQRKVVLHWADCNFHKCMDGSDDYKGLKTVAEVLQLVSGKVVPLQIPSLTLSHDSLSIMNDVAIQGFPYGSSTEYILSSEKKYQQSFPTLIGSLFWGADEDKQFCSVSFEPVSCRQRCLSAPVEVNLKTVLHSLDTSSLHQSASECWVLMCLDKPEQRQFAFQCLLKELSIQGFDMLAELSEGGLVQSAVLSVLSPYTALLTVIHPMATRCKEVHNTNHFSSESEDNTTDLPDIVSSVLNVMYDIMENDDCTEELNNHQITEWAHQELQKSTNLATDLTEGWFCLSDQSGISCHLMESMRLLHAAPEEEEQREEETQLELTHALAELYQSNKTGTINSSKVKKKGAQRTPVRQKMKSMSRSLQMLNVARFNIKEQKSQAEVDPSSTSRRSEKHGRRSSGERTKSGLIYFKCEEELLSHLKLKYQQAVEDWNFPVLGHVQNLLSVVKTFIKCSTNAEALFLNLIKKNLWKSTQSIRQLYESAPDSESKTRDCQIQVFLRLEVCRQPSSDQATDDVEHMVEEVAGMLRIISLTKDAVYLSRFMQEEVLPLYLKDIPTVLADIYHSLGTQLPEVLVAALPTDFFSDDSMAKESVSVSSSSLSATRSMVSSVGNQLEELRNRSAKKRRSSMLSRHKSMTEASQTLRQIEMPRKSTRQTKPKMCASSEKRHVENLPPQKQAVQEVTRVRRNLFNQECVSPSKNVKMPRSQSVSALEGMKKRKRSQMDDDHRGLLINKVAETPLHKQVSNRLLQRQKRGRRSDETDMSIIEESPIKPATDLRRSPRIKSLARRHSSVFYSSSQPRSRNVDKALSSSQLLFYDGKGVNGFVKSPMRLLFGAAQSPIHPSTSSRGTRDSGKDRLDSNDSVFENVNKTPRKSPHTSGTAVGSRTPRTPTSSSKTQGSPLSKSPGSIIGENGMILRGSPFRSPAVKSLLMETPKKSPLKGILRTPVKSFKENAAMSCSLPKSPNMRTPKKCVTWSPSPQKYVSEKTFKVPESPQLFKRCSPKLMTPSNSSRFHGDDKTPDKLPQRKCKGSTETHIASENTDFEEPTLGQRSKNIRRTLNLPEEVEARSLDVYSFDHLSPPTPDKLTPRKTSETTNRMCTRSGRTPLKSNAALPHLNRKSPLSKSPSSSKDVPLSVKEKPSEPFLMANSAGNMSLGSSLPKTSGDQVGDKQMLDVEHWTEQAADVPNEPTKGMLEQHSSSDSQQLESSEFSATSTEESIDIAEASVVKTELTGGIKMNISFLRKPFKPSENFEFTGTPSHSTEAIQERSYGFRQTPDRQQRKAAARLGYSPGLPRFSTPRGSGTAGHKRKCPEPNPLTYQVELEMQATGLPKLKFKRTDSFSSGEANECSVKALASNVTTAKASRVESPLIHCSKHREPGRASPSVCIHDTPGKGGVQTYICQSITPTRLPNNSPSPLGAGENVPWTPSPQSRGWATPENLNSWPRKKRARTDMFGTKETIIKGEADILEDPELDGVFRLQGTEDFKESLTPVSKCKIVATPPSSKVKKPVSVSAILALTQSPLLYKGAKASVTKETTQCDASNGNAEQYGNRSVSAVDVSPFSQPRRHQGCSRTYSRKRLLDS